MIEVKRAYSPPLVALIAVALVFGTLAYGGVMLTRDSSGVAAVWFPNAVLVALLLRDKGHASAAFLVTAFAANIAANLLAGDMVARAIGLSAVNVFEITAIWWGMHRLGFPRPDMSNLRHLLLFAAIGGIGVPGVSGLIATLMLGPPDLDQALTFWRAWSMTDGLGMLIVAPSILIIADGWRTRVWPSRAKLIEIVAIALAATGTTIYIFWQSRFPFLFLDAPVVLLYAFRLGSLGTAFAILDVAVIASIATANDHGPIHLVKGNFADQVLVLQIFLVSSFAMGLPVAATLASMRRLQARLRQSEAGFRHMAEAAPVGIFRADANGQLTYVNRIWAEKAGFTVEQMLGDGWMRALKTTVPFEEGPAWQGIHKPGDTRHRVSCFRAADGSDLWIETVSSPELDERGQISGFIGAAHDITEQRRASARLAETEQRFEVLANLAPAGIFRTDAKGGCTYVNASWLETTGLKQGEWEQDGWAKALHPEDQERVSTGWAEAVREERDYRGDFRWIKPDGTWSWVDVQGRPERDAGGVITGFIGVSLDITERRRAEQALAEREAQLDLLATNATDAVLRIALDGTCRYASPSATALLGVSAGHLVGAQLLTGFHADDGAAVQEAFARLASGAIEDCTIAYRSAPASHPNDYRWMEAHCGLVRDADCAPAEVIASIRDVSETKELEAELMRARARAEDATAAKSAFLANMSHEIRTPMNGVMGFTELLGRTALSSEQRRQVDLIADSGRSMMRLLNDILDMSKIDSGQMELAREPVDLRHTLLSASHLMEPIAECKGLRIDMAVAADVPRYIFGDKLRLRQIVLNLIGNAVKFTEEGIILVRADAEVVGAGKQLVLTVRDTGIGIAEDRLGLIFEQFAQADPTIARKYGGTGLGLAISNNLATLMGGTITVASVVGEGTIFTVRLPLVQADGEVETEIADSPRSAAASLAAASRILVAEDHDINQMLILALAEAAGVEADLANDGTEAVAMVKAAEGLGQPYDLVLMDMQMPLVDGLEATRQLRSLGFSAQRLPIIALTANAYAEDIQACRDAGMQAHLAKPVRLRDIKMVLSRFGRALPAGAAPDDDVFVMPKRADGTKTAAQRYELRRKETLEAVSSAARRDDLDGATVLELSSMLHKLAGSAGFFEEVPLGKVAADLERSLNDAAPNEWRSLLAEGASALDRAA